MKVEIHCEEKDKGTMLELANALINNALEGVTDYELAELRKKELAELAEYIQIYLKYNSGGAV